MESSRELSKPKSGVVSAETRTVRGQAASEAQRTAIVVLGMHRSGTSALTRMLSLLGAGLPKNLLGANPTNPAGHWESARLIELNDEILNECGSSWDDWRRFDVCRMSPEQTSRFKEKLVATIGDEFGVAPLIVLKEPRICRMVPLYESALAEAGYAARYVLPVRNPLSVASSLTKRDGMTRGFALMMWLRHVLDAESATRAHGSEFLSFEALVEDWAPQLRRLSERLKLEFPRSIDEIGGEVEAFLRSDLLHFSQSVEQLNEDDDVAGWVKDAYSAVTTLIGRRNDRKALATLDRIASEFGSASDQFGDAIFPESRERADRLRGSHEKELTSRAKAAEERNAIAERNANALADRLAAISGELDAMRDQLDSRQRKLDEMAALRDEAAGQIDEQNRLLTTVQSSLIERQSELIHAQAAQAKSVKKITALTDELETAQSQVAHLRDKYQAEVALSRKSSARLAQAEERLRQGSEEGQSRLEELETTRSKLAEVIAQRDGAWHRVEYLQQILETTHQSLSWRLTSPARSIWRRLVRVMALPAASKRAAGRTLHSAWRKMPVPAGAKARIKGAVFTSLPFVFSGTGPYKAWKSAQQGPQVVALPSGSSAVVEFQVARTLPALAGSHSYADYVQQIFSVSRTPSSGISIDYVPKTAEAFDFERAELRLIAFYLPQFHPVPENDAWWGKGFTEWTNVSKAVPQYLGHYQPHLPGELGFYDLRLVDVMRQQADLARLYGIGGFCFHHYWFGGRRLLERPVNQFLDAQDIDMPFCLCWANENWTRRWDGAEQDILMAQDHSPEDDVAFIEDLFRAFRDKRYIRFQGKPVLLVYRATLLPDPAATAARWRKRCIDAGIGDLYLVAARSFDITDPRPLGFDAAVEFPPHQIPAARLNDQLDVINPNFTGNIYSFQDIAEGYARQKVSGYPLIKTVMPSWDNEARKPGAGHSFYGATPATYAKWLRSAYKSTLEAVRREDRQPPFVFINAWNEWAEGAHLEPDRKYGYGYLHATANVSRDFMRPADEVSAIVEESQKKFRKRSNVAVVAHLHYDDLFPEMVDYLRSADADLFVSVRSDVGPGRCREILESFPEARLAIFPNRGRDVQPFLQTLKLLRAEGYELACKVHSKKSPQRDDGTMLRNKSLNDLLGSARIVKKVVGRFRSNPLLGMVVPRGSMLRLDEVDRNVLNRIWLDRLLPRMDAPELVGGYACRFSAGSMFWFRVAALAGVDDLKLGPDDFEDELGQVDGTLAHALERLFALGVERSGYSVEEIGGDTQGERPA